MQDLYYISESSTLTLYSINGESKQWDTIDNLIVCSSLYEIIAFSGSKQLVAFPIEETNLYYTYDSLPVQQPELITSSYATITVVYNMVDVLAADTSSCVFYVTSSTYSTSGSGTPTTLYTTQLSDSTYTFKVTGSGDYNSYLYIGDTTVASPTPEIGYILAQASGSNVGVSASIYLSASHNYNAYLTIIGNNAP